MKNNIHCILGIAHGWDYRKGLDVFIELSKRLPDNYKIILVGTNDKIDKILPKNIISIHTTNNQTELAKMYSLSDVFFNPTREDNYPTVNMEAIACGVPVVTFNSGGSAEMIGENCGIVLNDNTVDEALKAIVFCCDNKKFTDNCIAYSKNFDQNSRYKEYVELYRSM